MTLYASDLDGTLLRNDKTMSEFTVGTLNSLIENGILFTYATARSYASAAPLVKELKLNVPAVTFNGVFAVEPQSGRIILENNFTKKALETAKNFMIENDFAPLVYSHIDGKERVSYLKSRAEEVAVYLKTRPGDARLREAMGYGELFDGNVFYITILNNTKVSLCDAVFTEENGFSRNFQPDTYEELSWYEIYSKNAGKEKMLRRLCEKLGADEMICFGDNLNDIKMLEAAGVGCAVKNACEELKKSADIIIEGSENDGVARFIKRRESDLSDRAARFGAAVESARMRVRGIHGSVGTQNEKLIHAALKAYYAPFSDEQEIKIGGFFADAVTENGIFEIQSAALYRLKNKLAAFLPAARTTVVYPAEAETRNVFINKTTGEEAKLTPVKKCSLNKAFEEIYSLRELLKNENLRIIIARLKTEKRIYFSGEALPDMRSRSQKKRCKIEKIPLGLKEEITLEKPCDYKIFLPGGLPEKFTKKQLLAAAGDTKTSLRAEVLRAAGVIEKVGKKGNEIVYRLV